GQDVAVDRERDVRARATEPLGDGGDQRSFRAVLARGRVEQRMERDAGEARALQRPPNPLSELVGGVEAAVAPTEDEDQGHMIRRVKRALLILLALVLAKDFKRFNRDWEAPRLPALGRFDAQALLGFFKRLRNLERSALPVEIRPFERA